MSASTVTHVLNTIVQLLYCIVQDRCHMHRVSDQLSDGSIFERVYLMNGTTTRFRTYTTA